MTHNSAAMQMSVTVAFQVDQSSSEIIHIKLLTVKAWLNGEHVHPVLSLGDFCRVMIGVVGVTGKGGNRMPAFDFQRAEMPPRCGVYLDQEQDQF